MTRTVGGVSTPDETVIGVKTPPTTTADFAARLLAWHRKHGRHDLPWQQPRTPYRVWISEIMLQQTRVEAVISYFERFMEAFPDIQTLAAAPLDDVLSHWSGLGYYARARNLHRAAITLMEQHGRQLPCDQQQLEALPGIGRSTAAAIMSMGFDQPATILDGNVKRVLARYLAIEGWTGASATLRELWVAAEQRTPDHDAAAYSQGLMDLGATLCTRSKPQCGNCPFHDDCAARSQGRTTEIPAPRPKKTVPLKSTRMLILRDHQSGDVLLQRRPEQGIWGGLWSLPEQSTDSEIHLPTGTALHSEPVEHEPLRHVFTHFRLDIQPCEIKVKQRDIMEPGNGVWYNTQDALQLGLPRPVRTIIERLD